MAMEAEAQLVDISNREAPLAMVVNGTVQEFAEPFENGAASVAQEEQEQNNPPEGDEGDAFQGKQFRKKFGRKFYTGTVYGYEPENKWYKVVYEDGDTEELDLGELQALLASTPDTTKKRQGGTAPPKSNKKMRKTKPLELVVEEKIDLNQAVAEETPEPLEETLDVETVTTVEVSARLTTEEAKGQAKDNGKKRGRKPKAESAKAQAGVSSSATKKAKSGPKARKRAKTITTSPRKSDRLSHTPLPEAVTPATDQPTEKKKKEKITKSVSPSPRQVQSKASLSPRAKKKPGPAAKGKKKVEKAETPVEESEGGKGGGGAGAKGHKLRGHKLRKEFDGRTFRGEVAGYSRTTKYYKIVYEDGDEEELEWKELKPLLLEEEAVSSSSADAGTPSKKSTAKRAGKGKAAVRSPPPRVTRSSQKPRPRRKASTVS